MRNKNKSINLHCRKTKKYYAKLFVMNCTNFFTKCQNKVAENLVTSEFCVASKQASKQASISGKHQKEALADAYRCKWEVLVIYYIKKNYENYETNLISKASKELS